MHEMLREYTIWNNEFMVVDVNT